ncbi:MAG: penicillin-binding protein activator [Thaumarchaeota archaeon]|nr:penicillin-binding protein activator [Nitrososphaerota archaeon]
MPKIKLRRSGVSSAIAAVLLVVGLVIGAGVGYAATGSAKTSTQTTTVTGPGTGGTTVTVPGTGSTVTTTVSGGGGGGLSGTISIGVLDDLTDGLSGIGAKINFTTHQAINDINAYLQNTPYAGKVTFNVVVEDYALDNTKAQNAMNTFKSDGISVTVGPLNSGTAQALLSFANSNQIVMISPSSTAHSLAIPNDYLFRTAPTDIVQGKADAAMMWQDGVKAVIQVYRQDTYGSGLANYTAAAFGVAGGTVADSIPYDATTTNFVPILSTLNTDWNAAVTKYGADAVAIQLIAFDEGATLIQQASTNYPALLKTQQPWYGTDGEQGESVFTNSTIASAIQAVRLPSTVFGFTNSSKTQTLCKQLFSATSRTCDPYAIGSYDDVWIAALSILACGQNSGSCVQSVISTVADNYYGVSGWTLLDASGDRAASDYLIYCITGPASSLAWTVCGSWSFSANSVTWTNKPST